MWASVEHELRNILTTRVFHMLEEEPHYREILRRAGFTGRLPTDLAAAPQSARDRLSEAVGMYIQLARLDVEAGKSLRERRAKAIVIEGQRSIYRTWSAKRGNKAGTWWFDSKLLDQAVREAGGKRADALAWLRDRLAISLDMSDCDRLAEIRLGPSSALPGIAAWGLPMPQYTMAARNLPGMTPQEYYSKRSKSFQGGKTQYFLPFVPSNRITDYW